VSVVPVRDNAEELLERDGAVILPEPGAGTSALPVPAFRLEAGEVLVVDDHRWRHGRTASTGPRGRDMMTVLTAGAW
jgi:gamma-butyrobetaine dioxygenase